jgi:hypothetical protein
MYYRLKKDSYVHLPGFKNGDGPLARGAGRGAGKPSHAIEHRETVTVRRRRIRRGTLTHVRELEQAIHDYLEHHNRNPKPFVWTATANTILGKVKRYCERTYVTAH